MIAHHKHIFAMLCAAIAMLVSGCLSYHRGPLPGEPKNASFTTVADTRIRYIDVGQGEPVVLIHGFASSLDAWATVMPALTDNRRVIALDLKGFGWSERPEGDYSPKAQAALVFALLDELGVQQADLVAHSWGSSVALQMALMDGARVRRIVLYDAWVYADQLPTFFHWVRADGLGEFMMALWYDQRPGDKMELAFYDPALVTHEFVERVEEQLDRPGTTAAALAAIRGQRFEDWEHRYREIAHPVLLIWGRNDTVTRLEFGERLLTELQNARLEVFPRTGHFPMLEATGASNRVLAEFLAPTEDADESATESNRGAAAQSGSEPVRGDRAPQDPPELNRPDQDTSREDSPPNDGDTINPSNESDTDFEYEEME